MQYVHLDHPPELLLDLNPAGQRLINDGLKRNHIVAGGTCRLRELFDDRFILSPGGGNDIEVRQYSRAVDTHVEGAGTGGAEEGLGEVQSHRVARPRTEAGNGVAEITGACGLVDGHRRWICHGAQVNGVGVADRAAAGKIAVGNEGSYGRTSRV